MRNYFLRLFIWFIFLIVMISLSFLAKEYFGKWVFLFWFLIVLILVYIAKYSAENSHRLTMRKIARDSVKAEKRAELAKELGFSEKETSYYLQDQISHLEKKMKTILEYINKERDEVKKNNLEKQYEECLKQKELNQERLKKHPDNIYDNSLIKRFSRFLDKIEIFKDY